MFERASRVSTPWHGTACHARRESSRWIGTLGTYRACVHGSENAAFRHVPRSQLHCSALYLPHESNLPSPISTLFFRSIIGSGMSTPIEEAWPRFRSAALYYVSVASSPTPTAGWRAGRLAQRRRDPMIAASLLPVAPTDACARVSRLRCKVIARAHAAPHRKPRVLRGELRESGEGCQAVTDKGMRSPRTKKGRRNEEGKRERRRERGMHTTIPATDPPPIFLHCT